MSGLLVMPSRRISYQNKNFCAQVFPSSLSALNASSVREGNHSADAYLTVMSSALFNKGTEANGRGIGVDIVDIRRIRKSYEKFGERFLRRVLTENEISYCRRKKDLIPSVAARFAAKEALSKALGTGISEGFSWSSVEVVNDKHGKPSMKVIDTAIGIANGSILLSLSHDGDYAVAFVVLDNSGP